MKVLERLLKDYLKEKTYLVQNPEPVLVPAEGRDRKKLNKSLFVVLSSQFSGSLVFQFPEKTIEGIRGSSVPTNYCPILFLKEIHKFIHDSLV